MRPRMRADVRGSRPTTSATAPTLRFTNTPEGHRALIAWLTPHNRIARVVFEATGANHRAFERALAAAGLPAAKIKPRQARRFAEAIGRLAKTDRCDAALLARFGALIEPAARPVQSPTLDAMRELHTARCALLKDRTAALNRQKAIRSALLKRHNVQRLQQIAAQLAAIDAELLALCAADPDLQERLSILTSIPSIGQASALALLVEMPELGPLGQPQAASLAGLARGPRLRPVQGQALCPRRACWPASSPLHAGPCGDPLQPRPRRQVPGPDRGRKSAQARHHRRDAEAPSTRQRPPARPPNLVAKTRLITTDTLRPVRT